MPHRRAPGLGRSRPSGSADGRVQSVGGGQVASAPGAHSHRRGVLADLARLPMADPHARAGGCVEKRAMQHRSANAASRAAPERGVDVPGAVAVADSPEWPAVGMHTELSPGAAGYAASALRRRPCRSVRCAARALPLPGRPLRRTPRWPVRPGHRLPREGRSRQARQCSVFNSDPRSQQHRVEHREHHSRDPPGVYQR